MSPVPRLSSGGLLTLALFWVPGRSVADARWGRRASGGLPEHDTGGGGRWCRANDESSAALLRPQTDTACQTHEISTKLRPAPGAKVNAASMPIGAAGNASGRDPGFRGQRGRCPPVTRAGNTTIDAVDDEAAAHVAGWTRRPRGAPEAPPGGEGSVTAEAARLVMIDRPADKARGSVRGLVHWEVEMALYSTHYAELERSLRSLLGVVELSFAADQFAEVHDYLDHREYGLALETIASVVVDARIPIGPETVRQVDALALSMKMTGDRVMRRLHAYAG